MRILLAAADSKFIHSNLALRYLKKIADHSSHDVWLFETTINDDVDHVLADLISHHPNLLVFSCYIWNISFIRQLISACSKVLPDTLILCGGPEVAYDAQAFLASSPAHGVMAGEGEAIFPALLAALDAVPSEERTPDALIHSLRRVPGLYLKEHEGGVFHTGEVPLIGMEQVPFPYDREELDRLKHRIIYYEGQRGCPFGCSYCLSSIDRTLRHKPLDMVKRELSVFMEAGVPLVKLVDRTFNAKEDWAYQVLQYIVEETEKNDWTTSFHFEVGAAILSDRLIDLFNRSPRRLFQIEAGIQTTNPDVLRLIERRDDPDRLKSALANIIAGGKVHVHTDLIAGLPGDDLTSFRRSFNDCLAMRPQMLQVGFLKVLKGTPLHRSSQALGIRYRDWPPYEVLQTGQMGFFDLLEVKKVEMITDKYYNSGKFVNSMNYLLNICRDPWELFVEMAECLLKYQHSKSLLRSEDYYRVIFDLNKENDDENRAILADLLRFDYILSNRKGTIPEWLQTENYNSFKARLLCKPNDNSWLKGNVAGFKINVLRFWQSNEIIQENTHIFYSLASPDPVPVRHLEGHDFVPV